MGSNYEIYKEIKADFDKDNKIKRENMKKYGKLKIFLYWTILFLILIPQIVLFLTKKTYEYVPDIENLGEPIQIPASWWTIAKVYWIDVQIDYLAKYDISWRVISIRDYIGADVIRKLWSRDFTIGRRKLWREDYIDKFSWNDMKNRFIYYRLKEWNETRFEREFWWSWRQPLPSSFLTNFSNNHPIPANKKIKHLMKKIKEWDVVRLQWYLVYVYWEKDNRKYWRWPSSLVRDDTWDGACEIIYVTDVTRLKEK